MDGHRPAAAPQRKVLSPELRQKRPPPRLLPPVLEDGGHNPVPDEPTARPLRFHTIYICVHKQFFKSLILKIALLFFMGLGKK
jgi:hypothetical protein